MALKKPSDYFIKKETPSVNTPILESVSNPELNTFSDAFNSFKNNLSKIESLSEFSETLDNYRVNVERVNYLSEKIEDIQVEISSILKKEDLDRAMMSQLLVVEQSIRDIQSKVKGINEKTLTEIRLDVSELTDNVTEFLEIEVPKYKKLVVNSELRTNNRYEKLEDNVNKTLEGIDEFVCSKYQELTESLQGINEKSLAGILEDFKNLDGIVCKLKEQEIPKYKRFIVETEKKTESRLKDIDTKTDSKLDKFNQQLLSFEETVKDRVDNVRSSLKEFVEVEAPKYNKLLIENKLKTEEDVKVIQKNIEVKVSQFVSDIEALKSNALNESQEIDTFVTEKIGDFKKVLTETQKDVKKTLSTYTSISKTLENKVNSDNEKLNSYDETFKDFSGKISECLSQVLLFKEEIEINEELQNEWKEILREELLQKIKEYKNEINEEIILVQNDLSKNVSEKIEKYQENTTEEINLIEESLSKKVTNLEVEIIRNESHIKTQNKNIEQIKEDIKDAIKKLNLDELEAKNYKLLEKINYIEEIFEKFNEKEILVENNFAEPPKTKNEDPLTPLDKNYVTTKQLQDHYRVFINRIQQQLSTLGGGGETRLKYLDDIVGIATNPSAYDGKFLKYNHSISKFEFTTTSEGGSSGINGITVDTSNLSGITTDYLMIYDPTVPGFKFVNPQTYFGINNDANPDPTIDDFGSY